MKQDGWNEQRLQLRDKIIEAISETMDLYGVTPSVGKLYGILFFEESPMTLEEMKDLMGMSKSNMSYAVRALLDSKMVKKLDNKQDRKDLYQAEGNFFTAFQNFFSTKLQREIDVMLAAVQEVMPELRELILHADTPEEQRSSALKDYHKLVHTTEYYAWLQGFVDQIKEGKVFGQAPFESKDSTYPAN